jgi:TRAP transporter TAXI family solute receptor
MSSKPIRIIPLSESVVEKLGRDNRGLVKEIIPAKMYNLRKDVLTFTGYLHLIANEDLDDQLVYDITKTLIENIDVLKNFSKGTSTLTPQQIATDLGIPFHAGALKYYREKGLK